ncbi:MAG TPA: peptidoglycan bridge formation glycyltransferase FemA/FemB family protein [Chthonomonadaceae bacterium]|nr:peptidoglycan bridge formation glycyltransferase FemA/FemB family protein [Chthonomonadaceae bacterium]
MRAKRRSPSAQADSGCAGSAIVIGHATAATGARNREKICPGPGRDAETVPAPPLALSPRSAAVAPASEASNALPAADSGDFCHTESWGRHDAPAGEPGHALPAGDCCLESPAQLTLADLGPEWDERWDALACSAAESGFMQSSAWAAFKRAEGYRTVRLGIFAGERLIGGASLLTYPGHGTEGYWICPEGPVLPWRDHATARAGLRLIVARVEGLAEELGGIGLRIEPHLPPPRPPLLRNWSRAPVDLNPVHSLVLDVSLSNEELLAQMHAKGRYNIGIARRHGVEVARSTNMADLRRFYRLFHETAVQGDFFAEPYGFFLNLGASLFPARQAELFFSEWQGETLAALLVVYFGGRATYLFGGTSRSRRNVMPAYAAHWAAMQAARERGCAEYDLYGYDPFGQPDHLYAGFSRFKRQFGGFRRDNIGAYDLLFYERLAESLVRRLSVQAGGGPVIGP